MKRTFHRSTIYHRIRKERIRLGLLANPAENTIGTASIDATNIASATSPEFPDTYADTPLDIGSSSTANSDAADDTRLLTGCPIEASPFAAADIPSAVKLFAIQAKSVTAADLKLLLRLLHPLVPELPLDPRTLRGTPRSCRKYNLKNGCYVHLGLSFCLERLHQQRRFLLGQKLKIQVNIDGVTVGDYPGTTLWPILGRISEPFLSEPFVLGSFSGYGKPEPLDDYLDCFVEDFRMAMSEGVQIPAIGLSVKIELDCIICDTVARCYVKQTKGHSGYQGCDKCIQTGTRHPSRRMAFEKLGSRLRTDAEFRAQTDEDHHNGLTKLTLLPIDMVQQFPLDPMHMVFLGVVKRLTDNWRLSERSLPYRLSQAQQRQVDANISRLRPNVTIDFARKCSTFFHSDRWKATEYRQFLLYLGPVAIRSVVSNEVYENFLNFSIAIYILSHPVLYLQKLDIARFLIQRFIQQFSYLYGQDQLIYNVHCLSHLCDDVARFGPIHKFSSFPFENFMRSIKDDIKSPKAPAVQVHNRNVISHAWFLGENKAAWPLQKNPAFRRLLTQHVLPIKEKYVVLNIRLLKITKTLSEALVYERRAQVESTFTSTDGTDAAMPAHQKRKKRRVVYSSSEADSDGENVALLPKEKLFSYSPIKDSKVVNSTMIFPSTSAPSQSPPILWASSNENIQVPRKASPENIILQEIRSLRLAFEQNTEELKNLQSAVQANTDKLLVIEPLIKNAHRFIVTTPPVLTPEIKPETSSCGNTSFPLRSKEELRALHEELLKPDMYTQMVTTFSRIPRAASVTECVSSICSFVFTRELATQVNWNGSNGKEPLMTSELQRAIIDAVCCPHNFPNHPRGKVEYRLMRWFQNPAS